MQQRVHLATIQRIDISGLGGDDNVTITIDNGPITIPEGIHFDGGETTQNHLIILQLNKRFVWENSIVKNSAVPTSGTWDVGALDPLVASTDLLAVAPIQRV